MPYVFEVANSEESSMKQSVMAAVRTGPGKTELTEYPMPEVPAGGALLKVEVAGICGTDVKLYANPTIDGPVIMGHENIGIVTNASPEFIERKGLVDGDRIFVEHYVGCYNCQWCHIGEYRHCENTDWRTNPDARRYGYTSAENHHHLWGGFSQYMYLPWNSVVHKVPDGVSAELAGLVTPLSNGIQWALLDAGVGYNSTVLIQGPGQQGLSQAVACKQAGASLVIVTGTTRDKARLDLALTLGADYVIDVQAEDALERIMQITGGKGVDVVLDCTSRAGTAPILLGIEALKRREGTLLVQGELAAFPDFPLKKITEKAITIRSARGHSYMACELALAQLASGRFPLEKLTTHRFGLKDVDRAIKAVGGGEPDVIHVSLMPWMEESE
jgi:threonine dehydrogenase-like Zn-dependent dehydrogenase